MAKANPFTGRWRITSMSAWEDDFLDEEVEAYIEFDDRGGGEFHFGNVQGHMDWERPKDTSSPRSHPMMAPDDLDQYQCTSGQETWRMHRNKASR